MDEPKFLLVLGGGSDIGRACALRFAQAGWRVTLAGRDLATLKREAEDIATRTGVATATSFIDILDTPSFAAFETGLGGLPDAIVCVVGLLGEQRRAETDPAHASLVMRSNFEGPALLLGQFAEGFSERGDGIIVGVSSVAGDRGRASNYVYGAAKAGLTAFLSGLRNRFGKTKIRVVTVKPGFVRTKMTAGMKLPPPLTAEPQEVAEAIYRASAVRPRDVIYVKLIWRLIMTIIGSIPEPIFKRLKL
ncbi:short-chain dehydrogenase/reductase SDR [Methylocella silvestris BL2]|uniref:Short-chain dehydrogenase/reductase SDR n=1 Tax=Methylocella silvestris (strain DSM 15510 / CIP 108128 / LMG 27833 / NCIMB 13906 / BL2) TaxID=395965 RepID=B8ERQ0_METSB|nr:SDR family oxidoreductase [Methylocella silvestris]ACK51102.1 short-chain dehydrogenase/reductase SDR [Methylocella silvestris BL2]